MRVAVKRALCSPFRKSFTDESVPLHSTLKETEDGKLKRIKALYFTSVLDEINLELHRHTHTHTHTKCRRNMIYTTQSLSSIIPEAFQH
jgi:hypothetical protein